MQALLPIEHVWCMQSFSARLLGMHSIAQASRQHSVLFFKRCSWVHTLGLYSPHAVLFLDQNGAVLKGPLVMKPNRIYGCIGAKEVVELPVKAVTLRQWVLEQELQHWRSRAQRR